LALTVEQTLTAGLGLISRYADAPRIPQQLASQP
jgi:hypothetical protein